MKQYTACFCNRIKPHEHITSFFAAFCTLIDAETPTLAAYSAKKFAPRGHPTIIIESGDTRHLHSGAQEIAYTSSQTDVEEITFPEGTPL